MKKVLTIAGSDSGGGAGIQADLKTFAARGVYGMSALTAITAQNTIGVQGVFELPADFVGRQIDSVMNDMGADVWKTGMLSNSDIIHTIVKMAKKYNIKHIVVDPVMVAKSGDLLLKDNAQEALITGLIPIAYVVTPNLYETRILTGKKISTIQDMKESAVIIHKMGAKYVVVKGGHLPDKKYAIDILYDGKNWKEFSETRINSKNTHGTGCTFAACIAAEISKGHSVYAAVKKAKEYLMSTIQSATKLHIGQGYGPLNHFPG